MASVIQDMRYRLSLIQYAERRGISNFDKNTYFRNKKERMSLSMRLNQSYLGDTLFSIFIISINPTPQTTTTDP